jgi:hypothetical protein
VAVVGASWDRSDGILSGPVDGPARVAAAYPEVEAVPGLKVEHRGSRYAGAITRLERDGVAVRGRSGTERLFRLAPGAFSVGGRAVTLVRPKPAPRGGGRAVTASGSVAPAAAPARAARTGRILVEGVHDAELVEKVWGDDLRVEGVVVERLDGADDLAAVVAAFRPGPGRRLGVLLDHLVPGSKESRLAAAVRSPAVLVTGSPYVDVWAAIRPAAVGIAAWPEVPRDEEWKAGVSRRLGFAGEPREVWRQLLGKVRSYADLEPPLVGAVEQLIDFVTEPD